MVYLTTEQRAQFQRYGFLILPGFFARERVEAFKEHVDELWLQRQRTDNPLVIDTPLRTKLKTGVYRALFRSVRDEARQSFFKLNDAHLVDPLVQEFSADTHLLGSIAALLGHTPVVYNSLIFEWGSEQDLHFDTFYMPSPTPNMMAASWIAIDPVTESNGPLVYYPGSHLIEPFRFSNGKLNAIGAEMSAANDHIHKIIREYGLLESRFYPQPGDVLIWHAQLLHGGSAIASREEKRTSIVTHYFTTVDYPNLEGCVDIGNQRYMLAKPHHYAIDGSLFEVIADRIDNFEVTPEVLANLPTDFDPAAYLLNNPDLVAANVNPYEHYLAYGHAERRRW